MGRFLWVKDIIKVAPAFLVGKRNPSEPYDVFVENDPELERQLRSIGYKKEELQRCEIAISMGNSGASWLEPFSTTEEALQWIEKNAEKTYFVKWTNPELRKRFPKIPVKAHPKEVEEAFGIK